MNFHLLDLLDYKVCDVLILDLVAVVLTAALLTLGGRTHWIKWAFIWFGLVSFFCALDIYAPAAWLQSMSKWLFFPMALQITWHLLLAPLWILIAGLWLCWLGFMHWRGKRVPAVQPLQNVQASTRPASFSRREFISVTVATAAPIGAAAMGIYCDETNELLQLRRFDIAVRNLPPELEGFTIAHVSDLHSGLFCGPERLKVMTDQVNELKADLIAVTGDLINMSGTELPHAMEALRSLNAPFGIHLCQGNHDLNVLVEVIQKECDQAGMHFHNSSYEIVQVQGRRLVVGGVPWMDVRHERHDALVESCFPPRQDGDVRVLLAHHPHFFDSADGADLVLSGHTHGGQIMLGDVGIGSMVFRYWSGKYRRGDTTLVVSNGSGDWFPCRIGAPAEVGLLTLRRA